MFEKSLEQKLSTLPSNWVAPLASRQKYIKPLLVNSTQLKLADDGMAGPIAPSNEALCSIAAYLKLAAKTDSKGDSKLPNNFISGETTLVVGDNYCNDRKTNDNSCACDKTTLTLSTYKRSEWVNTKICNYMKDDYIPYLQSQLADTDPELTAARGYRCYKSIVCSNAKETDDMTEIESGDVKCGADPVSFNYDYGSNWARTVQD